jgi:hypothetical protein
MAQVMQVPGYIANEFEHGSELIHQATIAIDTALEDMSRHNIDRAVQHVIDFSLDMKGTLISLKQEEENPNFGGRKFSDNLMSKLHQVVQLSDDQWQRLAGALRENDDARKHNILISAKNDLDELKYMWNITLSYLEEGGEAAVNGGNRRRTHRKRHRKRHHKRSHRRRTHRK